MITLALSRGRILDETLPLLEKFGLVLEDNPETTRKLILPTNDEALRLILVRASDVPTYVQYGAADLGIAGWDVLEEQQPAGLYYPLDLGIGRCKLMVAVPEDFDYATAVQQGSRLKVATKYVNTTLRYFDEKGVHVDVIKLYGSMELAPLVGLADAIVDLVSSGKTLAANNLVAVDTVLEVSARMVTNQTSYKIKRNAIDTLLHQFSSYRPV